HPAEQGGTTTRVEGVGSTLAVLSTEDGERVVGQVEAVHRHGDRRTRQLADQGRREGRLAGSGATGNPDQQSTVGAGGGPCGQVCCQSGDLGHRTMISGLFLSVEWESAFSN